MKTPRSRRSFPDAIAILAVATLSGSCSEHPFPVQPSPISAPVADVVSLEAEAGSGDGRVVERSRASGGLTVHLAPGEHRRWTFRVRGGKPLALWVTYSNGKEGDNEVLTVSVDGVPLSTFADRDSGDAIEGWNLFVTDPAGTATLDAGSHTLSLESSGGDGCVEIDLVALSPAG